MSKSYSTNKVNVEVKLLKAKPIANNIKINSYSNNNVKVISSEKISTTGHNIQVNNNNYSIKTMQEVNTPVSNLETTDFTIPTVSTQKLNEISTNKSSFENVVYSGGSNKITQQNSNSSGGSNNTTQQYSNNSVGSSNTTQQNSNSSDEGIRISSSGGIHSGGGSKIDGQNSTGTWWQKAYAYILGLASITPKVTESSIDAFVNWGTQLGVGASYIMQGLGEALTGNDYSVNFDYARQEIKQGAMDFIATDYTKKLRDSSLSAMGVTDPDIYSIGDEAEDVASDINKAVCKNAFKGGWRFLGAGILATIETGEEVQNAYQSGATYWEGAGSAHVVAATDMVSYGVLGDIKIGPAAGFKSATTDFVKDGAKYVLYENRNYSLLEYVVEKAPNIIIDALLSGSYKSLSNKLKSKYGSDIIKKIINIGSYSNAIFKKDMHDQSKKVVNEFKN